MKGISIKTVLLLIAVLLFSFPVAQAQREDSDLTIRRRQAPRRIRQVHPVVVESPQQQPVAETPPATTGVSQEDCPAPTSVSDFVMGKIPVTPTAPAAHVREYIQWNPVFQQVYSPTPDVQAQAVLLANGGVNFVGGYGVQITSLNSASVIAGLLVEWEVPPGGKITPTYFSIFPEGSYGFSGDFAFIWQTGQLANSSTWGLFPEGIQSSTQALKFAIKAGDKIGIFIRPDGVAEYHVNFESCKPPVFVSSRPVQIGSRYRAYMRQNSGEVPPFGIPGVGVITAAWRRPEN